MSSALKVGYCDANECLSPGCWQYRSPIFSLLGVSFWDADFFDRGNTVASRSLAEFITFNKN